MEQNITPAKAQYLLDQAARVGSATRSDAGWPAITMLLGIGVTSSLGLIAFGLAHQVGDNAIFIPMISVLAWLLIFMAFGLYFMRSAKRGFGKRWALYIALWGALWTFAMAFSSLAGHTMGYYTTFAALICAAVSTCAVIEARK